MEQINFTEEDIAILPMNEFDSLYKTILEFHYEVLKTTRQLIEVIKNEIASALKTLVISKLKPNIELSQADIYIKFNDDRGWYALFVSEGRTYAFSYNYRNDTYAIKHVKKPISYYLTKNA